MSDLNEAIAREQLDARLADALRGHVKAGTEGQMARLIGHDFELQVGADGRPAVSARSGKPVAEELAGKLASGEFAHFRSPSANVEAVQANFANQIRASMARQNPTNAPGLAGTYGKPVVTG